MPDYNERAEHYTSKRLEDFSKLYFAVDKLHIQGHKEDKCLKKYHPNIYPELKDANTVICEQINFRLGRFKFILRHMNAERFYFYIYIILNEMNRVHSEGRYVLYDLSGNNNNRTDNAKRAYQKMQEEEAEGIEIF
jgi:hypothetical protein